MMDVKPSAVLASIDTDVRPKVRMPRRVIYLFEDSPDSTPEGTHHAAVRVCCCHRDTASRGPLLGQASPLGLFGFGSTVLITNISVAGFTERNVFIDCVANFFGGFVQLICGFHELVNGNNIGGVIATGFGAYNTVNGFANVLPATGPVTSGFKGGYLTVWLFFALTVMLMNCRGPSLVTTVLNSAVVVNFLISIIAEWTSNSVLSRIAGYEGFFVGSLAIYMSLALSLRAAHGKSYIPVLSHHHYRGFKW